MSAPQVLAAAWRTECREQSGWEKSLLLWSRSEASKYEAARAAREHRAQWGLVSLYWEALRGAWVWSGSCVDIFRLCIEGRATSTLPGYCVN